jgi:hypothetical protein
MMNTKPFYLTLGEMSTLINDEIFSFFLE